MSLCVRFATKFSAPILLVYRTHTKSRRMVQYHLLLDHKGRASFSIFSHLAAPNVLIHYQKRQQVSIGDDRKSLHLFATFGALMTYDI